MVVEFFRFGSGVHVALSQASMGKSTGRLCSPQAVSKSVSSKLALRFRWVSRAMRKTLTPAILCSARTRTLEMRRLASFSYGVSSPSLGFFLGWKVVTPWG